MTFNFTAPAEPGAYDLQATILGADGQTVTSDRAFPVISEADQIAKGGYPVQAATASSERARVTFRRWPSMRPAITASAGLRNLIRSRSGLPSTWARPEHRARGAELGELPMPLPPVGNIIGRAKLDQVYSTDAGKGGIETSPSLPSPPARFGCTAPSGRPSSVTSFGAFTSTRLEPSALDSIRPNELSPAAGHFSLRRLTSIFAVRWRRLLSFCFQACRWRRLWQSTLPFRSFGGTRAVAQLGRALPWGGEMGFLPILIYFD